MTRISLHNNSIKLPQLITTSFFSKAILIDLPKFWAVLGSQVSPKSKSGTKQFIGIYFFFSKEFIPREARFINLSRGIARGPLRVVKSRARSGEDITVYGPNKGDFCLIG